MSALASAGAVIENARVGMRRAAVRRQLHGVAIGKSQMVSIDLEERGIDVAGIINGLVAGLQADSLELQRLEATFQRSGTTDAIIDGLASTNAMRRARSARMVGALRLEQAVAWLGPLLASTERPVADAAARALGRIGGVRSAEALLLAIQRTGSRRTLIVELARAAPDLFLEGALSSPQRLGGLPAVAIAAGLRRRRAAVGPLLALLTSGTRRQRVISCRALGWIGAQSAAPLIAAALQDREWRVRMSAAKALAALHATAHRPNLETLVADRNPRVRKAGQHALRRIETAMTGSAEV